MTAKVLGPMYSVHCLDCETGLETMPTRTERMRTLPHNYEVSRAGAGAIARKHDILWHDVRPAEMVISVVEDHIHGLRDAMPDGPEKDSLIESLTAMLDEYVENV